MASRKEKVNAGLFVLIGVLLLGATVAIVAGVTLERAGEPYLIKIPKSVGALREGSAVKYLGVPVGRVKEVDFPSDDLESVRVLVEITRPSTPMREGTFATLSSNFLTGETSIELQGGANQEKRLLPGTIIEWRPTTLMRLEDSLPSVLDELKRAVANLNELLGPRNQERFATVVDEAGALARDTRAQLEPMAAEWRAIRAALAESSTRIADSTAALRTEVTASVREGVGDLQDAAKSIDAVGRRLEQIVATLAPAADDVAPTVAALRLTVERLAELSRSVDLLVADNRAATGAAIDEFAAAAAALAALLEQLDENPSQLLFSDPPQEHVRGAGGSGSKPTKGGS